MSIFEQITFDDRDFETEWYQSIDRQMSQEGRPHIFVRKLRERPHSHKILDRRDNPSWYISVDEFASIYAAAEFAAKFNLHLDMHVTIDFGRMGKHTPGEVQKELSNFTHCYVEWCRHYGFHSAWIAVVEMSSNYEYHAHIALHVPGDIEGASRKIRREFRKWAKGFTGRRGVRIPRAVYVRGGSKESLLDHWIIFHYLVKGFDRKAVLCSARNSPDGMEIRLGDIVARWHRDPGPVRLKKRVFVSNNIGPARRAFGAPTGLDHRLPQGPNFADLDISRIEPLTADERRAEQLQVPVPTPFRSMFEDGIYDVRRLYSNCFYELVTKMPAWQAPDNAESETEPKEYFNLSEHLRSIDI